MRPTQLLLGLALASAAGAGLVLGQSADQRPVVPLDTLPRPLERVAPLGVEDYEAAWSASAEEVALGRRLFFEPRLSLDSTVACASCHLPELGFADDRALSLGVGGQPTKRNAPSLVNKALSTRVLWDGRAATLEDQALLPIDNPAEMALGTPAALDFLKAEASYAQAFQQVFGGEPSAERLASALAAFVRALVAGDSPVDRFRAGDIAALDAAERAGMWLYEGRAGCWRCHSGPNFSDEGFHNTGVGAVDGEPEPGRAAITGAEADRGRFRTPGLRLLTKTAPYMHDGSLATLEEVVEFYRGGGGPNPGLSRHLEPLELDDRDAANLVAFLRALSR